MSTSAPAFLNIAMPSSAMGSQTSIFIVLSRGMWDCGMLVTSWI